MPRILCPNCHLAQASRARCIYCQSAMFTIDDVPFLRAIRIAPVTEFEPEEDIEAIRKADENRFKPKGEQ